MAAREGRGRPAEEHGTAPHRIRLDDTASQDATATFGAPTYEWQECPDHPWYGVSVIVLGDSALCVPPLDGTPNHWVAP